jgi:UDP-glucose 4-epimerase
MSFADVGGEDEDAHGRRPYNSETQAAAASISVHGMREVVLVTGGCGFIGSHVVDKLAVAGYEPRILDTRPSPWHDDVDTVIGDIRHLDDVRRAMRGCHAICHLAAAADVGEVHAHPAWATELNSMGTLNVLEAAREAEITRVVYASTVWVYSDVEAEAVDEETLLPQPAHLYTAGKLSGELYCRSYSELYGLEPTIVRFGIPYGPRARPAAVIPSFVDRAMRGEPLTIAGTGEQERSFVYVEDLAEGVVRALATKAAVGRTYNLGGRETITIRGLAEIVRDEVAETPIVHTDGRAGDLRGARIDSDRAERELGWCATTPLREGVRRYAAWVREYDGRMPVPATAAAPAVTPTSSWRRSVPALVAAGIRNPTAMGLVALIAVASACLAVVLGAREEALSADFTVLGLGFLAPLWSLMTAPWAPELRRIQAAAAVALGTFDVLVLGALSATIDSELPRRTIVLALAASAALVVLIRLVPRNSDAVSS